MKLLSLICFSLLIVSCSTNQTREKTSTIEETTVSKTKDSIQVKEVIGKPFFNFDNVTHYQSKAKNSVELLLIEDTVLSHSDSILALTHYHFYLGKQLRLFKQNINKKTSKFFRVINEIPTILLIIIVFVVVFKPL